MELEEGTKWHCVGNGSQQQPTQLASSKIRGNNDERSVETLGSSWLAGSTRIMDLMDHLMNSNSSYNSRMRAIFQTC